MAEDLMDKVFSFFSSDGMSDEKQNMLKLIGKELSQNKFSKYFRVRSEEIDPSLTSFLFSVYKSIYPIRLFMQDEKKANQLKQMTIESCMDNAILGTLKKLDPVSIESRLKTTAPDALINEIQTDTDKLVSLFNPSRIAAANRCYEMAADLKQLVSYNYPAFFKKFDTHFADGSFLIEPKFPPLKTILIVDEIGELLSVSESFKPEDNWAGFLNLIKACAGQELVVPGQFIATVKALRELHTSRILELMVQYTLRNPIWRWKQKVSRETVGEDWLEEKKAQSQGYIDQISTAMKNTQIAALTKEIFEATDLVRLENYTSQLGELYHRRGLVPFIYAEGLNYLKAYLDDYADREVKELCDILVIRGQWTDNNMSRELSSAIHDLLESRIGIADLDQVMSEDGGDGSRLRAAMLRVERDKTQVRYINSIVTKNNDEALEIINLAAQNLIIIGKHLKVLIEDFQKKHPELLINWRELNLASKEPIAQRMIDDFKQINYFVQLMRLCTQ
jgi:hypothetical protein